MVPKNNESVDSAMSALKKVQEAFKGEAERLSLSTEDDVVQLVKTVRNELADESGAK